jgi:hypothetical protein
MLHRRVALSPAVLRVRESEVDNMCRAILRFDSQGRRCTVCDRAGVISCGHRCEVVARRLGHRVPAAPLPSDASRIPLASREQVHEQACPADMEQRP